MPPTYRAHILRTLSEIGSNGLTKRERVISTPQSVALLLAVSFQPSAREPSGMIGSSLGATFHLSPSLVRCAITWITVSCGNEDNGHV